MPATRCVPVVLLAFAATAYGAAAHAQTPAPLPTGKVAPGQTSDAAPAVYRFSAPAAGVLTVAVQADEDVSLLVTDAEGQALPDGTADRDLFGSAGNEQITVTLPEPGEYRVHVRMYGSGASKFQVGSSWIAMPGFARTNLDPDRRPSLATAIEPGQSREDTLNSSEGDAWDWFLITPKTGGTLTVILRSVNDSSPDLALELYSEKDLSKPVVRSDDDLQGNTTHESATIDVAAGEKVYVKVVGAVGNAAGPYRLASSLIQ